MLDLGALGSTAGVVTAGAIVAEVVAARVVAVVRIVAITVIAVVTIVAVIVTARIVVVNPNPDKRPLGTVDGKMRGEQRLHSVAPEVQGWMMLDNGGEAVQLPNTCKGCREEHRIAIGGAGVEHKEGMFGWHRLIVDSRVFSPYVLVHGSKLTGNIEKPVDVGVVGL